MRARLRSFGLVAVALAWVVPLGACTDDSDDPPSPGGDGDSVALELSLGPGADDLSAGARDDLQNDIGAVLSTYVVDGFLGDYPRESFVSVLDLFRADFADDAATGLDDFTGASFSDADEVVATRLQARVSTFAHDGKAVGVSAVVDFDFDVTEDGKTRQESLSGRLFLDNDDGEWKIFGYRVLPVDREDDA